MPHMLSCKFRPGHLLSSGGVYSQGYTQTLLLEESGDHGAVWGVDRRRPAIQQRQAGGQDHVSPRGGAQGKSPALPGALLAALREEARVPDRTVTANKKHYVYWVQGLPTVYRKDIVLLIMNWQFLKLKMSIGTEPVELHRVVWSWWRDAAPCSSGHPLCRIVILGGVREPVEPLTADWCGS